MDFSFCIFNILLANCLASLESSRNQNDVIDEDGKFSFIMQQYRIAPSEKVRYNEAHVWKYKVSF